jgi:hypothetical protein
MKRPLSKHRALPNISAIEADALSFAAVAAPEGARLVFDVDAHTPSQDGKGYFSKGAMFASTKRKREQRQAVLLAARRAGIDAVRSFLRLGRPPCCAITLTRISPLALDDDNLRTALKAVRDELAEGVLGMPNDRDPRVVWIYGQAKPATPRTYAVRVLLEAI